MSRHGRSDNESPWKRFSPVVFVGMTRDGFMVNTVRSSVDRVLYLYHRERIRFKRILCSNRRIRSKQGIPFKSRRWWNNARSRTCTYTDKHSFLIRFVHVHSRFRNARQHKQSRVARKPFILSEWHIAESTCQCIGIYHNNRTKKKKKKKIVHVRSFHLLQTIGRTRSPLKTIPMDRHRL